jgi:hypothetical protein
MPRSGTLTSLLRESSTASRCLRLKLQLLSVQCTKSSASLSCSIQVIIQVLNFLMIFMLLSGTYLFQVGLIGVLVGEFKSILYAMPAYLCVYLTYSGFKIANLQSLGKSLDELWDMPAFIFLSVLDKVGKWYRCDIVDIHVVFIEVAICRTICSCVVLLSDYPPNQYPHR